MDIGGLPSKLVGAYSDLKKDKRKFAVFIVGFLVIIAAGIISLGFWFAGFNAASGSSDPRTIEAGPTSSAQPMLRKLMMYAKPEEYVSANIADLQAVKKEITELQQKVTNSDPSIKLNAGATKQEVQTLLSTMANDVDEIIANKNDQNKVLTKGKSLIENRKKIQKLIRVAGYLNVPKVTQGRDQLCGRTSAMMVLLYYSGNVIESYMSQHIKTLNSGTPYTTGKGSSPLNPSMLNEHTGKTNWVYANAQGKNKEYVYNMLKKSIDGGDPVILYTYGAIYSSTSNHIVVVTGYDDSDKSLIINNPATLQNGDTEVATKKPNRGRNYMSIDNIYDHLGEKFQGYSGHSFLIRQNYL